MIFGHDRAGPYDHVVTNRNWQNSGICSNANMITNLVGRQSPVFPGRATDAKQVVNEHRAMGNETVVPDSNQLADKSV